MKSIILSAFILMLVIACQNKHHAIKIKLPKDSLVSINLQDSHYIDHLHQLIDTVTADGWKITYLVKPDSTKYTDVYIRCSKGNQSGTYYGGDLLLFKPGFVPVYIQDAEKNIYFYRRCGTSCDALLVFKKDATTFEHYSNIAGYNLYLEEIVYLPYDYDKDASHIKLNVVNLKKSKEQVVHFNGEAYAADIYNSVDSIHFDSSLLTIYIKTLQNKKVMQEVKTVHFK